MMAAAMHASHLIDRLPKVRGRLTEGHEHAFGCAHRRGNHGARRKLVAAADRRDDQRGRAHASIGTGAGQLVAAGR